MGTRDAVLGIRFASIKPVSARVITILPAFPVPVAIGSETAVKAVATPTAVSIARFAVSALPVTSPVKSPTKLTAVTVPVTPKPFSPETLLNPSTIRALPARAVPGFTPSR